MKTLKTNTLLLALVVASMSMPTVVFTAAPEVVAAQAAPAPVAPAPVAPAPAAPAAPEVAAPAAPAPVAPEVVAPADKPADKPAAQAAPKTDAQTTAEALKAAAKTKAEVDFAAFAAAKAAADVAAQAADDAEAVAVAARAAAAAAPNDQALAAARDAADIAAAKAATAATEAVAAGEATIPAAFPTQGWFSWAGEKVTGAPAAVVKHGWTNPVTPNRIINGIFGTEFGVKDAKAKPEDASMFNKFCNHDYVNNAWTGRAFTIGSALAVAYGVYKAYEYVNEEEKKDETPAQGGEILEPEPVKAPVVVPVKAPVVVENAVVKALKAAKIESFKGIDGLKDTENAKLAKLAKRYQLKGKTKAAVVKRNNAKASFAKTVAELIAQYSK